MKQIIYGLGALDKIMSGANKLNDAVSITLGPKGKNVAIERKYTYPLITNDGVTIAKEIELEDLYENIGASSIKEACIKSNETAGDGTTSACVLATEILNLSIKNIAHGANPVTIKRGMQKALDKVVEHLQKISKPVKELSDIFNVATISAGGSEVGKIIADAFKLVGKDGVITVEDGKTTKTELKINQGMQFDKGFVSPYMVTDTNKMIASLTSPLILVTDQKITNINQIIHILENVNANSRSLLIIADDYETEVINTLVINKLRGNLNVVCVKSPAFGDNKKQILLDICTHVHATLISTDTGTSLNQATIDMLGEASQVSVNKDHTIISGGKGNAEDIKNRCNIIREEIKMCDNDFNKTKLKERLARLTSGIAVIQVGSNTEIEMQELKLRIEDAIESTKSAIEEGIVPGGGVALLSATKAIDELIPTLSADEQIGAKIISDSLSKPIKTIANNAGVSGDVVLHNIMEQIDKNIYYGYDALNNKYGNMFDMGIIDPTKVTRSAISNACSVASTLMTTECIIVDSTNKQ